jgi:hypothetical protein
MARTSGYPLADRALGGQLGGILIGWEDEGLSLIDMVIRLDREHDLTVSPSTIGRWLKLAKANH